MNPLPLSPDERAFRDHLAGGAFRLGVHQLKWRLVAVDWPTAIFAITAAPRSGAPDEYHIRLELTGYPASAPTGQLWDTARGVPLNFRDWPVGTGRFSQVFRTDWQQGTCLYLPADRISLTGHSDWPGRYASQIWTSQRQFTHYLTLVHELLTSSSYSGRAA